MRDPGIMIPAFIQANRTFDPIFPGINWALTVGNAISAYMQGAENINKIRFNPFSFVFWMTPVPLLMVAQKSYAIAPWEFGIKVGIAIERSIMTIYTHGQINLVYVPGQLPIQMAQIFEKPTVAGEIPAVRMATAIHAAVSTILVTCIDTSYPPQPLTGPLT